MASGKEIKARIKTVKNTAKITKAMELISTVKMKKAQDSVSSSRPFAIWISRILSKIEDSIKESIYVKWFPEKKNKVLAIVISWNKGLCWWYNVNIFKKIKEYIKDNKDKTIDYISVGKKWQEFIARTGWNLIMDFSESIKDSIELSDAKSISREIIERFKSWEYWSVVIFYSYYYSAISQKVIAKQFLTISKEEIIDYLENIVWIKEEKITDKEYKLEPDKITIANEVVPLILDMIFYEIILEAKASEHASRMVAMKNAKDSAGKKVFELTLTYNKARQAGITKEVSEIVSWVESMKD